MENQRVKALIKLLEDPNEIVYNAVEKALLKEDKHILPQLELAWEKANSDIFHSRLNNIIHQIQFKTVKKEMHEWIASGAEDLLYGSYLVAKYRYYDLLFASVNEQINSIWRDLRQTIKFCRTPIERVKCINSVVFEKYNFSRNADNPASHRNNYINDVIDSHKGNHITLSIIYVALCNRLNIPVRCVSLPKLLILCYIDEKAIYDDELKSDSVLFYINAISRGGVLGKKEVDVFLAQQGITPHSRYYIPCSNVEVIRRLLVNLSYTYDLVGNAATVSEIEGLLKVFDN